MISQYPVRPAHMSYDTSTVVQSRVRPGNQQVELSLALNADGPNFDVSKGEQMALNVDGCDGKPGKRGGGSAFGVDATDPDDKLFSSGIMDKQVLVSTKANLDTSRYAVGILGSNEFHVTPISSVLHMRPDLKYLDKSDKTAKAEGRALEDPDDPASAAAAAGGGGGPGQDAPELKPVTVRFSKSGDAAKKHREKSYEYQMKKAEEEPWRVTRFHHVKSSRWEDETQLLFCRKMDEEATALGGRGDTASLSGGQAAKEYLRNLTS